jgi:hypothetical protein
MKQSMQLPIIYPDARRYYVDFRLEEIRACDNPHDRMTLEEWRVKVQFGQVQRVGLGTYVTLQENPLS